MSVATRGRGWLNRGAGLKYVIGFARYHGVGDLGLSGWLRWATLKRELPNTHRSNQSPSTTPTAAVLTSQADRSHFVPRYRR